jgi:hypothetical protein
MSARSTACGTISRGQSCIDSVHVVVEQDHVLRRTPVWRRRYEGREIERARNREDPDTARKWDDLERTAPVVSFPGTAWVCTTCTAGLRVGRVRLARELRGRARGWTSLARGGRQGLHDLTWCAADPGTVLWTARGASPATGASRVTALTISVFVWCVRPPSRGSTHGRGPRHPRLRPAGRAGLDTASPTPRPPASRGAFASRSCRNRGPSAWAASPTRCRCGARRQCPPAPCDRRAAGGRPSGAAVVRGARAPPMPRARRRPDVRLSAQATAPYRSREVSLRALNTSRVSVHPPSILSRHRQEPCRGWLRGPLRHESHNRAFPRCGGLQLTFCADSANKDPGQESHVTSPAAPAATGGKRAANRVGSLRRSGSRS